MRLAGSDDVAWEAIARTRRSVREYLDTLDEAAWGAASETVPKFISKSDPAAQWTGAHKGHAFFAYADNYLIDLKAAIIVDVAATRGIRQAEVGAARTMIERTEDCLGLCPERPAADSAYGSAEMLGWLVSERAIEPHIPVFDKSARDDGTFSRGDFNFNQEADIYVCPAGNVLTIIHRKPWSPLTGNPGSCRRVFFGCRQPPKGRLASWLADLPALIWIVLRDLSGDARRGRA